MIRLIVPLIAALYCSLAFSEPLASKGMVILHDKAKNIIGYGFVIHASLYFIWLPRTDSNCRQGD